MTIEDERRPDPTLRTKAIVERMVAAYEAENYPQEAQANSTTFSWLIETGDHKYWDGRGKDRNSFTSNPNDAVRFARAEDANRVIYWLMEPLAVFLVAREHGWMPAPHPHGDQ